jgi:Skp family chaperone for outer membrane proteins
MLRSAILSLLATGALLAALPASAPAQDAVAVSIVNADRVYNPRNLRSGVTIERVKPALVDAKTVFAATPEYKKIKSDSIKKESAEYRLLISGASSRFKNAVKRVMSLGGYDLVAETGAITVAGRSLPDVTQEVVDNL